MIFIGVGWQMKPNGLQISEGKDLETKILILKQNII